MTGEARFCPRCGTRRAGFFRFCAQCGFDFDELLAILGREAEPSAPAPTRSVLARPIRLPIGPPPPRPAPGPVRPALRPAAGTAVATRPPSAVPITPSARPAATAGSAIAPPAPVTRPTAAPPVERPAPPPSAAPPAAALPTAAPPTAAPPTAAPPTAPPATVALPPTVAPPTAAPPAEPPVRTAAPPPTELPPPPVSRPPTPPPPVATPPPGARPAPPPPISRPPTPPPLVATVPAVAPPVAAPPAEPAAPSAPAAWPPPGALPADEVERQLVPRRPTPTLRPNEVAPGARVGTAAPTDRTPAYTPAAVTTTRVGRSRITSVLARRPDLTLTRVAIVALAAILAVSAISNFVRASLNSNPGAEPSGGVGSPIVGEAPGVGSPGSSAEPAFGPIGPTDFAVVSGIVDGDTIRVDINGTEHRLRYIGIDSPEPDATDPLVKRLADAATAANAALVEGEEVYLEREESDTDQFGRLLRDVWVVDDTGKHVLINMTLVRLGYAQISTFPPDVRYVDELLMAQEAAQEEGLGLWASGTSGSPIGSGEAPVGTQIAPPPGASHDHAASPAPAGSSADCHPSYSPCLPIVADLDCAEVRAIGAAPVTVKGPDDYELDPAEDLLGCEPDE